MGAFTIPPTIGPGTASGHINIPDTYRLKFNSGEGELYYASDIHGAGRDAIILSTQDTIVIAAGADNQKRGYVQMGTSSGTYEYFLFQHNGNASAGTQTPGSKKLVFASYYWSGGVGTNYRAMSMRHKTSATGVGTMDFYANETVGSTTGETDAGTHIFSIREGIGAFFPTGYGVTFNAGGTIASSGGRVVITGENAITAPFSLLRTSDLSRTADTTLAADTVLTAALTTGTYRLQISLVFNNASGTPGNKAKLAFSGTATTASGVARYGAHGGVSSASVFPNPSDANLFAPTFTSASQNNTLVMDAILVVTVGGTLDVQWSQNTSSADATTLKAGSFMLISRI